MAGVNLTNCPYILEKCKKNHIVGPLLPVKCGTKAHTRATPTKNSLKNITSVYLLLPQLIHLYKNGELQRNQIARSSV